MSPIIQATIALTWSTIVGVVVGYHLHKFTHRCPRRPALLRVPPGARARLELDGDCEFGEGAIENAGEIVVFGSRAAMRPLRGSLSSAKTSPAPVCTEDEHCEASAHFWRCPKS